MRVIAIRVALVIAALAVLVLSYPAAMSGWHTLDRTETESFIIDSVDPDTGTEMRMYGDYCTEDTNLDGGRPCYASSYTVDLTTRERWQLAIARGGLTALAGIVLVIVAFAIGRPNETEDEQRPLAEAETA